MMKRLVALSNAMQFACCEARCASRGLLVSLCYVVHKKVWRAPAQGEQRSRVEASSRTGTSSRTGGKPRPYIRAWRANWEFSGVSTKEEALCARQLFQQRRRRLHQAVEGHIVGNAEVFPPLQHLLGNLFHGANEDGRHLQNLLN